MGVIYGSKDRCAKDWLTDTEADSDAILNMLERAAVETDNIVGQYIGTPVEGTDLTDAIRRLNEQMAAGFYLLTQKELRDIPLIDGEHPWVVNSRMALEKYITRVSGSSRYVVEAQDAQTSPLNDDTSDLELVQ